MRRGHSKTCRLHPSPHHTPPPQVNDRYEFYDTLDLDRDGGKYLSAGAPGRNVRNVFKLLAVLVHAGGLHGGHYYAFIRCVAAGVVAAVGRVGVWRSGAQLGAVEGLRRGGAALRRAPGPCSPRWCFAPPSDVA